MTDNLIYELKAVNLNKQKNYWYSTFQ